MYQLILYFSLLAVLSNLIFLPPFHNLQPVTSQKDTQKISEGESSTEIFVCVLPTPNMQRLQSLNTALDSYIPKTNHLHRDPLLL